jgi:hypothetical protein
VWEFILGVGLRELVAPSDIEKRVFALFTSLASEDSGSLRASLAAYADLLGRRFVSGDDLTGSRTRGKQRGVREARG